MHHTKDDRAIYNIGNEDVVDKVKNIKSTKVSFTSQSNIKSDLYLKDDALYLKYLLSLQYLYSFLYIFA